MNEPTNRSEIFHPIFANDYAEAQRETVSKGDTSQRQPWGQNPGRRTPSVALGDPAIGAEPSPRHWRWAFGALPHPQPRSRVPSAERDSDPPPGIRSRPVPAPALLLLPRRPGCTHHRRSVPRLPSCVLPPDPSAHLRETAANALGFRPGLLTFKECRVQKSPAGSFLHFFIHLFIHPSSLPSIQPSLNDILWKGLPRQALF